MSKKKKVLILATFLAMVIVMLIIIIGITKTALPLEKVKIITGTVHYINEEDGFRGIIGADGKHYDPLHLPRELRRPGLKAEFRARILEGHIGLRMWGTLVEILEYKIIH